METLERFKKYSEVSSRYEAMRFNAWLYMGFAVSLYLFVGVRGDIIRTGSGIAFIFFSLLFFRLLDDAGSVHNDRIKFPERTYLAKGNYSLFIAKVAIFGIIYFAATASISFIAFQLVAGLAFGSILLYVAFGKNEKIREIIPLLKYPVLLRCIVGFDNSNETAAVLLAPVFLIGLFDFMEKPSGTGKYYFISALLMLVCGYLVFGMGLHLPLLVTLAMIVAPLLFLPLIRKNLSFRYVLIPYYPVLYFILKSW